MRVFHFLSENHALDDIRRRRLKVATFDDLNDPFELFSVNLADPILRAAFEAAKELFAAHSGLLCFSRDWHNPVLWSHYAGRHTGFCLGFEVRDDDAVHPISYSRKRLVVHAEELAQKAELDAATIAQFMFTKYSHWRYETEVRAFVDLDEKDPETGLYFSPFSEDLRLTTVIVGALSTISRSEVQQALGDLPGVDTFKARLAFRTFRVIRQGRKELWR